MTDLVESYGLVILFFLIALESAGVPLPGETALIGAGLLASQGKLEPVDVVVVAAAAAIIGDNGGYWAGRLGGRRLLERWSRIERWSGRVLPTAERFFARHGGKTVFIGRFIAILRVTAAWLAGISHMPWWRFFFWNATGGILWATLVGLIAYYFGRAAADAIGHYGLIGGAAIAVLGIALLAGVHFWRRRMLRRAESEA